VVVYHSSLGATASITLKDEIDNMISVPYGFQNLSEDACYGLDANIVLK
jgi:hypothetical protein